MQFQFGGDRSGKRMSQLFSLFMQLVVNQRSIHSNKPKLTIKH